MPHEVLFAPEAQADLLKLYDHIADDSGAERARRYTDRIVATTVVIDRVLYGGRDLNRLAEGPDDD